MLVSVPAHLRHLFPNQRDLRRSTGTHDESFAKRKQHALAQEIYDLFDQRQREEKVKHFKVTDAFAADAIFSLATVFKHRNIPDLRPSTPYHILSAFKQSCDTYAGIILNQAVPEELSELTELIVGGLPPEEIRERISALNSKSQYSMADKGVAGNYMTEPVHTFWQDLLISAAQKQGLPEPTVEPFTGPKTDLALIKGQIQIDHPSLRRLTNDPVELISRPARIVPSEALTYSSVMPEYLERVERDTPLEDTKRKKKRWAKQFLDVMGDLEIAAIKPKHAYDYLDKVLAENPKRSNKTLRDYIWGVQDLLKYCVQRDYIQSNPFRDLDLKPYGEQPEETYPFEMSELRAIFAHDWNSQDRLLLSILVTTGMRPSEAGNLTWERFDDTEHEGIRYFTTLDTADEKVRVKNSGSKRLVPIHPDLQLPKRSTGRLFDYEKNEDGLSATEIGHQILPILHDIVPHPNKNIRSFRKTFKRMCRDKGVEEEVHDAITGHRQTASASRANYGGMGVPVMFEAISKLDVSFLNGDASA
ncbi:tyrosine-type recombinase/integrase [Planktomarina temperata]|nr:tyrosine-type recombinase/integrase [Planktomarina temperata]